MSSPENSDKIRCGWVGSDPLYLDYHDREWGVPEWDERSLLEKLILDGAQAGLSWITILRKRENYRRAFDGFDPEVMARYDERKLASLLSDAGIVRNRLKIEAAVWNARAYLSLKEAGVNFAEFLWNFVGGKPIQNWRPGLPEIPAQTPESQKMSRALTQKGFRFVGPVICYAFMQATGMVNDHTLDCFRHSELCRGLPE